MIVVSGNIIAVIKFEGHIQNPELGIIFFFEKSLK
jgi:hypothetical protein